MFGFGGDRDKKKGKFDQAANKRGAAALERKWLGPLQGATDTLEMAITGGVTGEVRDLAQAHFDMEVLKLRIKCMTIIAGDGVEPEQKEFEKFEKDNFSAVSDVLSAAARVIKQVDIPAAKEILQDAVNYGRFCQQRAQDEVRQLSTAEVVGRLAARPS
jgi:hypothetical protein